MSCDFIFQTFSNPWQIIKYIFCWRWFHRSKALWLNSSDKQLVEGVFLSWTGNRVHVSNDKVNSQVYEVLRLSRNSRPFESPRDFCERPRDFCYFQKGREIFVKRPRDFCKRPRDICESQKSLGLFSNSPYFWQKSLGLLEQKSLGLFPTYLRLHSSVVI